MLEGFDDPVDLGLGRIDEVGVVMLPDFFSGVADFGGQAEVADMEDVILADAGPSLLQRAVVDGQLQVLPADEPSQSSILAFLVSLPYFGDEGLTGVSGRGMGADRVLGVVEGLVVIDPPFSGQGVEVQSVE